MFERKVVKTPKGLIWRMNSTSPAGAFVAPSERGRTPTEPAEHHDRGLRASSLELSNGSNVMETEMDTLPGELIDAFTKVRR